LEQQKRNFEGADILFTRVLNRATQLGDRRGAAEAALGQAVVARRKGAFEEADELYAEAASEFAEGDDLLGVARARHGLAAVERQRLRVDLSEKLFREAQAIADELGATELVMDCRVGLADVHRLRGEFDRARRAYEAHVHWAEREHLFEAAIVGHLRLAHVALLQDDQMAMYKHAVGASLHLERVPGHWLWASYRLSVATQLALREDEDQTYRWLWSAAELGLADTIDHDIAYMLTIICHVASSHQWLNVMKVSSKLASGQWTALRLPDQVAEVAGLAIAVLGESGAR
jgi:tetratricopeptide (TPR) repeat protein